MSDEEIRALERDATPAGRLKLARALERLGRRDEALDALITAREDRAVQAELARFPAWTHEGANEGNTFSADVAPVLGQPRPVWKHEGTLDPGRTESLALQFLATPALAVFSIARGRAAVHDMETGEVLWQFEHGDDLRDSRAAIVGSLLLLWTEEGVTGRDLYTGDVRWRLPGKAWEVRSGIVLFEEGRELVAFEVRDAVPVEVWRGEMPEHHDDRGDADRWCATARRVYVRAPRGFTEVDRASGKRLASEAQGTVFCADDAAALCSMPGGALVLGGRLLALGGRFRAPLGGARRPLLGPAHAVAELDYRASVFDRADGRAHELTLSYREDVNSLVPVTTYWCAALARNVLYAATAGAVSAVNVETGRLLWEVVRRDERQADAVIPAQRRLLTFARDGTVTCYR